MLMYLILISGTNGLYTFWFGELSTNY